MRREFPTSIYSKWPRAPLRPTYRKATLLDIVRAEKRLAPKMRKIASREARERTVGRNMAEALDAAP